MSNKSFLKIKNARQSEDEALTGGLDAVVEIQCDGKGIEEFDGNKLLESLATTLRGRLEMAGVEFAQLEMTLTPKTSAGIGAVHLVRGDSPPGPSQSLSEPIKEGALHLIIHAGVAPSVLEEATQRALEEVIAVSGGLLFRIARLEHFTSGMPVPALGPNSETA